MDANEAEALDKPLTEMDELDLLLVGTLADFVGLSLLVNEPISFLDKPLDEVGGLDSAADGKEIDLVDEPVAGVAETLVSVAVLDFLEDEPVAVDN